MTTPALSTRFAGCVVPAPRTAFLQSNGRATVVVSPPLGRVSARQFAALTDIAKRYAFESLTTTADGAIEVRGIDPVVISEVVEAIHAAGLPVCGDRLGDDRTFSRAC